MATAGSSVSNHLTLTENQKRWLVTGIALNKVLGSQIRDHLEQEIQVEYNNLTTSHSIHTQSTSGRLKCWPARKVLKYENINGNDVHPKLTGRKNDYSMFDCQVTSHVDFAKLYLEDYMAKFTAFDENCDASAVLVLLGSVPVFPAAVQVAAFHVRKTRNAWAHCAVSDWDAAMFEQSFDNMEKLVRALGLSIAEEEKIVKELRDWEKKGTDLCMNSPVDPALLRLIQQEVRVLQGTVDNMRFEVEMEKTRVQSEIQSILSAFEEMSRWVGNKEERVGSLEGDTSITFKSPSTGENSLENDLEENKTEIRREDSTAAKQLDTSMDSSTDEGMEGQSLFAQEVLNEKELVHISTDEVHRSSSALQTSSKPESDNVTVHEDGKLCQENLSQEKLCVLDVKGPRKDSESVLRCTPRPLGRKGRETHYRRGCVLDIEENREAEFKSLVSAAPSSLPWKIMEKAKKFICACLNADKRGIIYFGVGDCQEQESKYKRGEVLGLEAEDVMDDIVKAFQSVLDDHLKSDAGTLQKGGEQNCVSLEFVPVVSQGIRTTLYVIEIEVVRDWKFCKDNIYYSKRWTDKRSAKSDKNPVPKKALSDFYKVHKDEFDDVAIRTNGSSTSVKQHEVIKQVKEPLRAKYKEWKREYRLVAARSEKMKHFEESHIFPEIAICEGDIRFYASFFDESTRGWLIDDIQAWFSDPGHSRAYVLLGDPGIGKSVVAAVLCQRMRGQLAGAFFCRHNDSTRRNPRYLIGTIAHQLCECNSDYRNCIGGLSTIRKNLHLDSLGVKELFTKLLEEPLNSCAPSSERMLVVIDALDESEYDGHKELLYLVKNSFSMLPSWLVFFVTSRPEETIQYELEVFNPCVRICSGDSRTDFKHYELHLNDIRIYITNEVGTFSVVSEPDVVEGLLQKCEGMFLYAHYIFQHIKTHNIEPRQAVALYPNRIRDFYRQNFKKIHRVLGQELFHILIGCSLVAPSPLPVSIIPYLLEKVSIETQLSEQRVRDAISTFFPLRDTEQTFTFLHNLIPRWLTDRKEAKEYYLDRNSCCHWLAQIFIEILKGVSENTLSENEVNNSFLAYCLRHGIRYLCEFSFKENEYRQAFNCLTSVYYIQANVNQSAFMCYSLLNDYRLLRQHEAASDLDRKELENFSCVLKNSVHVLAQFPWLLLQCLKGNFSGRRFSQFNQQLPFCTCDTLSPILVLPYCFHSNAVAFALSPDRKLIAVVKPSELQFHLYLMNFDTFEAIAPPVRLPVTEIHDLKFSPNGQYIFFGSLLEWCSVDGTLVKFDQFEGRNGAFENINFICDGKYFLVRMVYSEDTMCSICNHCIACLFRLPLHCYTVKSRDTLHNFLCEHCSEPRCLLGQVGECICTFRVGNMELSSRNAVLCGCTIFSQTLTKLYDRLFRNQVWELSTGKPLLQLQIEQMCRHHEQSRGRLAEAGFEHKGEYSYLFGLSVLLCLKNIRTPRPVGPHFTLGLIAEESMTEFRTKIIAGVHPRKGIIAMSGDGTGKFIHFNNDCQLKVYTLPMDCAELGFPLDYLSDDEEDYEKETTFLRRVMFYGLHRTKGKSPMHPTKRFPGIVLLQEGKCKLAQIIHDRQQSLYVHAFPMDCAGLVFSPNGSFFALRSYRLLMMFSPTSCDLIASFNVRNKGGFSFTSDSQFLVFMSAEGTIKACKTGTLQSFECLSYSYKQTHDGLLNWWCFSNETKEVMISYTDLASPFEMMIQQTQNHTSELLCPNGLSFTSSCTLYAIYSDSHTRTWMLKGKALILEMTQVSFENCPTKTACILAPSSSTRVFLCTDSEVLWYDLANPIKQKTTVAVNSNNAVLAFSACGRKVLCYNEEVPYVPYVVIYNVDCGTYVHFQTSGGIEVECGCFLPNNSDEVVLCGKFQVEIWNCTSMEIKFKIPVKIQPNYALGNFTHCAVSVDGKLLACSYIDRILIFCLETRRQVGELGYHLGQVAFCQFFRTQHIVSHGVDGCVFLWDLRYMTAVGYTKVVVGNEKIVALSVSPDDDIIACGLSSGRIAFIRIHNLSATPPSLLRFSNSRPRFASIGSVDPVSGPVNSVPEGRQDTVKEVVFFKDDDDFTWEDILGMDFCDGDESSDSEPATDVEREEFDH